MSEKAEFYEWFGEKIDELMRLGILKNGNMDNIAETIFKNVDKKELTKFF